MEQILEPAAVVSLSGQLSKRYEGMAFDGQFFYLTLPVENRIYQFSRDFIFLRSSEVERPYSVICYDNVEKCFWASEEKQPLMVFRLDCELKETGQIKICSCHAVNSCIRGLSCNAESNTLLAAYENCVLEIQKEGEEALVLQRSEKDTNLCILSVPPFHILIQRCRQRIFLNIFCGEEQIECISLPECYRIKALLFCCCDIKKQRVVLFILAVDAHSRPCILKYAIDLCGKKLCDCNFICGCHGKNCCDNIDCCCGEDCDCDIIESIAKSECALAHILNAEGEKLQKAVELAENICDLLKVNRSVQKTITRVTFLEQVLYAKLEAVIGGDHEESNMHK